MEKSTPGQSRRLVGAADPLSVSPPGDLDLDNTTMLIAVNALHTRAKTLEKSDKITYIMKFRLPRAVKIKLQNLAYYTYIH